MLLWYYKRGEEILVLVVSQQSCREIEALWNEPFYIQIKCFWSRNVTFKKNLSKLIQYSRVSLIRHFNGPTRPIIRHWQTLIYMFHYLDLVTVNRLMAIVPKTIYLTLSIHLESNQSPSSLGNYCLLSQYVVTSWF